MLRYSLTLIRRCRDVSVWNILRRRPSADDKDPVTCLHNAGLALVNSILIQSIHHCDGRGQYHHQCLSSVSVIFVNENENENGEKREKNEFVNENKN